ncbi:hypothetical protein D3C81_1783430 [compost metagenome]
MDHGDDLFPRLHTDFRAEVRSINIGISLPDSTHSPLPGGKLEVLHQGRDGGIIFIPLSLARVLRHHNNQRERNGCKIFLAFHCKFGIGHYAL